MHLDLFSKNTMPELIRSFISNLLQYIWDGPASGYTWAGRFNLLTVKNDLIKKLW